MPEQPPKNEDAPTPQMPDDAYFRQDVLDDPEAKKDLLFETFTEAEQNSKIDLLVLWENLDDARSEIYQAWVVSELRKKVKELLGVNYLSELITLDLEGLAGNMVNQLSDKLDDSGQRKTGDEGSGVILMSDYNNDHMDSIGPLIAEALENKATNVQLRNFLGVYFDRLLEKVIEGNESLNSVLSEHLQASDQVKQIREQFISVADYLLAAYEDVMVEWVENTKFQWSIKNGLKA